MRRIAPEGLPRSTLAITSANGGLILGTPKAIALASINGSWKTMFQPSTRDVHRFGLYVGAAPTTPTQREQLHPEFQAPLRQHCRSFSERVGSISGRRPILSSP